MEGWCESHDDGDVRMLVFLRLEILRRNLTLLRLYQSSRVYLYIFVLISELQLLVKIRRRCSTVQLLSVNLEISSKTSDFPAAFGLPAAGSHGPATASLTQTRAPQRYMHGIRNPPHQGPHPENGTLP